MTICVDCGKEISCRAPTCPGCGAPNDMHAVSERKVRLIYILLALFLGMFGVHNFYAGYVGRGVLQLIFSCTGFLAIVTLILVIADILTVKQDSLGQKFA